MLVKTSELTGVALDYAVAMCEDLPIKLDPMGFGKQSPGGYWVWPKEFPPKGGYLQIGKHYSPSKNWQQAGPIIEREGISTKYLTIVDACNRWHALQKPSIIHPKPKGIYGPTPLISAMRCYVASKMGEEVEILEGLL